MLVSGLYTTTRYPFAVDALGLAAAMFSLLRPSTSLYARYLCSPDALGLKAGQARRATIGYLVYKVRVRAKVSCMQVSAQFYSFEIFNVFIYLKLKY